MWGIVFLANVHDQLALGKKLRILTTGNMHSCYCPATDVRFQYRGEDVVWTLERIRTKVGSRGRSGGDNGCTFISCDLDLWACAKGVTLDFSPARQTDRQWLHFSSGKAVHWTAF